LALGDIRFHNPEILAAKDLEHGRTSGDCLVKATEKLRGVGQVLARQAAEAREIADRLEDAEYIPVGTVKASE
jgi:hypothetical protein